jgi:DnaJ family protein B protein 12
MESNREDAKRCIEIAARELAAGDQAKALKFARKAQALYPSPEADSMVAQATSAPATGAKASTASPSSATGASAGAKRPATVRARIPQFRPLRFHGWQGPRSTRGHRTMRG